MCQQDFFTHMPMQFELSFPRQQVTLNIGFVLHPAWHPTGIPRLAVTGSSKKALTCKLTGITSHHMRWTATVQPDERSLRVDDAALGNGNGKDVSFPEEIKSLMMGKYIHWAMWQGGQGRVGAGG